MLFKDTPHLQADYRDAAKYGYVAKNGTLYLHSAHNTYPYLQSGEKLSWSLRNQAKLELLAGVILTGGVAAALVFLSSMPTLMFLVIGILVLSSVYLYLRAYQTANKELFTRWIDARDKEDKLNIADYLNLPLKDMHYLDENGDYVGDKNNPGLLIQHPAVAAALPNDSSNPSYQHLAISFNSAKNPLSKNDASLIAKDAQAKLLLVGHQPAATAQMTSHVELKLIECDTSDSTITNECGGGVVVGNRFLSIQSHQKKKMLFDSESIFGFRLERLNIDDLNANLESDFHLKLEKAYITWVTTINGKQKYKCYQANEGYNDLTPCLFPCSSEELKIHIFINILENAVSTVSKRIEDNNSDLAFLEKANQAVNEYKNKIGQYQKQLIDLSSPPGSEAAIPGNKK